MFKILTYFILFYFAYRFFIKPSLLPSSKEEEKLKVNNQKQAYKNEEKGGEYIDYEEVE